MVTKEKKASAFSIKDIYRSIVSPGSSGRAAAEEYIENRAREHTYVSTRDCLFAKKSHEVKSSSRMARKPRTGKQTKQKSWIYHFSKQVKS